MISGKNFVILGNNMWESHYSNTVLELMSILSQENNILYVDYAYTLKNIWEAFKGKYKLPLNRILGFEPRLRKVKTRFNSHVHVLTPPPVLPYNNIKSHLLFHKFLNHNGNLVGNVVKKAIKHLNIKDHILLSGFNPYYGNVLCGKLNEKLNVYYCYDEIDAGWHRHHGASIERQYIQKTDLVITSSKHLYEKKSMLTKNCYLIRNGVDYAAFSKYAFNTDVIKKNKKLIGYTGSIDSRFDVETVTYLIQQLPNFDFLFVGRVTNQNAFNALKNYNNVILPGSRKPEEVPALVGQIDIGIVPYLKTPLTEGVYPLKFNEYLAAGKPVVSTDFASLPEFNEMVSFAKNKEEFLNAVLKELNSDNDNKKTKRIIFAQQNSWINKAEEFSQIIESHWINNHKKKSIIYE